MQTKIQLQVSPQTALQETLLKQEVIQQLSLGEDANVQLKLLKRSIDARGRNIKINLSLLVSINEAIQEEKITFNYLDVSKVKKTCHIIGAGPAG